MLLSALPADGRPDALRIGEKLHLDPVDWYREAEATPHLATVADAVWNGIRLSLHDESWTGASTPSVDPLGLVLKAGSWYLVAAMRARRPPSAWPASCGRGPCRHVQRPRNFDLAAWWTASARRFERELLRSEATVLAAPAGLRGLRQLGRAAAREVDAAAPSRRSDGRLRLQLPIESIDHATGPLLQLAPEVEVVAPAALRAAVVARLHDAARCYRTLAATRR